MPSGRKFINGIPHQILDRRYCQQSQQVTHLPRHPRQSVTMGMWDLGAPDIPPKNKIEVFLHRSIRRILGIIVAEVKDQHITNETVRKKLFDIPNIEKHIKTRQLTFIGKVARYSDDHISTKILTAWCNYNRRCGGVMHTNNISIIHTLRLIIPVVEKIEELKKWAHFALDDRYWRHLISGLGTSST